MGARCRQIAQFHPREAHSCAGPAVRSGFADLGGCDLIAQGMGRIMHVTGEPEGPPTSVGLPIYDLATGMWAVQDILAAL
jgi:crotonobetainyl-CoA:carnitine CoA-transferase CaiB-like acyl-CoA transferase